VKRHFYRGGAGIEAAAAKASAAMDVLDDVLGVQAVAFSELDGAAGAGGHDGIEAPEQGPIMGLHSRQTLLVTDLLQR